MLFYHILHVLQLWGFTCRSQETAGKSTCQDTWPPKPQKFQENQEVIIYGNNPRSQKMAQRSATKGRGALGRVWGPPWSCGPPSEPLRHTSSSWPKTDRGVMTQKCRGSIIVFSISRSVDPNEEQKVLTNGFQQGFTASTKWEMFLEFWYKEQINNK